MDTQSAAPIGVFDSGVGGLSVVRELQSLLPHEDILYLADSANCPYGPRPDEEVRALAQNCADFLIEQGAKIIVVACNTASAAGLTHLRLRYGPAVPIVGLVPAVKPAVEASITKQVGVLATQGTLRGSLLNDVIARCAVPANVEVTTTVPAGLVELIEAGDLSGFATRHVLNTALAPLLALHIDALVLGCTHYPLVKPLITEIAGPGVAIFDSGSGVSRQTQHLLAERNWLNSQTESGYLRVFTSGQPELVAPVISRLLGHEQAVYSVGELLATPPPGR